MRRILLLSVDYLALPYASTLSQMARLSGGGGGVYSTCELRFSLQILSETFLILWGIHRYAIINTHRYLCNVPIILATF